MTPVQRTHLAVSGQIGLIDRFNNAMNDRESVLEVPALTVLKLDVVTG
jgi:hypothetical protein